MLLKPFFIFENDFNLGFTFTANACVSVRYGEPLFFRVERRGNSSRSGYALSGCPAD
jgi:hypothetical protein